MLRVQQQRPSSVESESDVNNTGAHETLVRKLRVSESKKKAYSNQAQNVIRKQSNMIKALGDENNELKKNLALAGSTQNEIKAYTMQCIHKGDMFQQLMESLCAPYRPFADGSVASGLDELIRRYSLYREQIAEEERLIAQLEGRIKEMESSVNKQRKNMGGVRMSEQQHLQVSRQLRIMENRQNQSLVKFNTALSTNATLRDKIDHLRKERRVFEGLQRRLQKELVMCKCQMGEVIEKSTQSYTAREDAQAKLLALKEKADKDLSQYQMELKELIRVIDHDQKLRSFMTRKDQERSEAHREMEAARTRKMNEKAEEREKTIISYEEAFRSIQKATGNTDIDQLVNGFIEVEDEIFALFNYVNELSGNMELIQEAILSLSSEMKSFQEEGVALEKQRQVLLKNLEDKLASCESDTQGLEERNTGTVKVLHQLKSGVDSVFSKIGCDGTAISELLGGHAGVTDNTVLQYLGIVEQRTNELLQLQAFLQAKESDDPEAISKLLMIRSSLPGLTQPALFLPSTSSEPSIEGSDDEGIPLTQDELRQRAMQGLTKRESRKAGTVVNPVLPSTAAPQSNKRSNVDKKRVALATR